MGIASGAIAYIDFEDYGVTRLLGQGTAPYVWSEHDANGGILDVADAFYVIENGAPSGMVARRNSTNSGGVDGRSQIVLQSGIPGTGTYDKLIYQWDMSCPSVASQWGAFTALQLRPSGAVYDGKRVIYIGLRGKRTAAAPNNAAFQVWVREDTTTISNTEYALSTSDVNENYSIQIIDDTANQHIDVLVNASGMYEHILSVDNDFFLDHAPSGAFLNFTGGTSSSNNVLINNFSITAFSQSIDSVSGYIGGYIEVPDSVWVSGYIGGYIPVPTPTSGYIGGYSPNAIEHTIYANDTQMQGVWKFDEAGDNDTREDSSGKGNHLNVILGNPTQVAGKDDNAIQFEHWNEPYPSVARTSSGCSAGLSPTSEDWTFGGWIKPSGGAIEYYAQVGGKGGEDGYVIYLDPQLEIWSQVRIDGIRYTLHGGRVSGLSAGSWSHLDWVVNRTEGYHALYRVPDDGVYTPILLARSPIPSGTEDQDTTTEPFVFGASPMGREPFDGQLDEWYFRTEALGTEDLRSICLFGLEAKSTTDTSGYIGGYVEVAASPSSASGYIGGYMYTEVAETSGYIGGYLFQDTAINDASGYIGCYILTPTNASGYIGGYILPHDSASGYIGCYLFGRHDASGTWLAYFDVLSTQFLDFDAQARIGSAENSDFDATCIIERVISPPTVECAIDGAASVSGYAVTFSGVATVADITLLDGRSNYIESAFIKWGDFSGQMVSVNSIGQWQTTHIYTSSGVYIPRIDVVDSNGAHGFCSKKVDLSVGLDNIIELDLTASPQSGTPPLAVAFTNTYSAQPAGVKESVIDFGDRTLTHLNNPTHLYRYAGHYRAIWIVKDDRGRFFNDSTDVGVNV